MKLDMKLGVGRGCGGVQGASGSGIKDNRFGAGGGKAEDCGGLGLSWRSLSKYTLQPAER